MHLEAQSCATNWSWLNVVQQCLLKQSPGKGRTSHAEELRGGWVSAFLSTEPETPHLFFFSENHLMLFRQGDNHAWRSSVKPIYFGRVAADCRGKLWVLRNCFPGSTKLSSDQITELFFWKSHEVNLGAPAPVYPSQAMWDLGPSFNLTGLQRPHL